MSTNRRPLNRRRRAFDPETMELFSKLETTPLSRRHSAAFREDETRLARRLGLGFEKKFLRIHVLDRAPCHWSPTLAAHGTWHEVRKLRFELLEAAGLDAQGRRRLAS